MSLNNIVFASGFSVMAIIYCIAMVRFVIQCGGETGVDIKEVIEYGLKYEDITKSLKRGDLLLKIKANHKSVKSLIYFRDISTHEIKGVLKVESKSVDVNIKFTIPSEKQIDEMDSYLEAMSEALRCYSKKNEVKLNV